MLSREMFTESLIYYLFFEVDDLQLQENARLFQPAEIDAVERLKESQVSMELWRKVGLVWVKRGSGGKFLSWTRVKGEI